MFLSFAITGSRLIYIDISVYFTYIYISLSKFQDDWTTSTHCLALKYCPIITINVTLKQDQQCYRANVSVRVASSSSSSSSSFPFSFFLLKLTFVLVEDQPYPHPHPYPFTLTWVIQWPTSVCHYLKCIQRICLRKQYMFTSLLKDVAYQINLTLMKRKVYFKCKATELS